MPQLQPAARSPPLEVGSPPGPPGWSSPAKITSLMLSLAATSASLASPWASLPFHVGTAQGEAQCVPSVTAQPRPAAVPEVAARKLWAVARSNPGRRIHFRCKARVARRPCGPPLACAAQSRCPQVQSVPQQAAAAGGRRSCGDQPAAAAVTHRRARCCRWRSRPRSRRSPRPRRPRDLLPLLTRRSGCRSRPSHRRGGR